MSLRNELLRANIRVLQDHIGLDSFSDEDFAFLNMIQDYGDRRQEPEPIHWGGTKPDPVNTALPQAIPPAEPKPTQTLDRGPEPQTIAETLSTEAPKAAGDHATFDRLMAEGAADANNATGAPDYETLITRAPADSTNE